MQSQYPLYFPNGSDDAEGFDKIGIAWGYAASLQQAAGRLLQIANAYETSGTSDLPPNILQQLMRAAYTILDITPLSFFQEPIQNSTDNQFHVSIVPDATIVGQYDITLSVPPSAVGGSAKQIQIGIAGVTALPYGAAPTASFPSVAVDANTITYYLQLGIPAGAPGAAGTNGANGVTTIDVTNAFVSGTPSPALSKTNTSTGYIITLTQDYPTNPPPPPPPRPTGSRTTAQVQCSVATAVANYCNSLFVSALNQIAQQNQSNSVPQIVQALITSLGFAGEAVNYISDFVLAANQINITSVLAGFDAAFKEFVVCDLLSQMVIKSDTSIDTATYADWKRDVAAYNDVNNSNSQTIAGLYSQMLDAITVGGVYFRPLVIQGALYSSVPEDCSGCQTTGAGCSFDFTTGQHGWVAGTNEPNPGIGQAGGAYGGTSGWQATFGENDGTAANTQAWISLLSPDLSCQTATTLTLGYSVGSVPGTVYFSAAAYTGSGWETLVNYQGVDSTALTLTRAINMTNVQKIQVFLFTLSGVDESVLNTMTIQSLSLS